MQEQGEILRKLERDAPEESPNYHRNKRKDNIESIKNKNKIKNKIVKGVTIEDGSHHNKIKKEYRVIK